MDVVARTTTLRASIQRDAPDASKAAEWLARASELSTQAKALPLTQPDLIIESANLATRMGDLTTDLRALATAEKGADAAKKSAAHKRVLGTSEQVEVLTREPAARCSGDPKALKAQSGRISASKIAQVISDHFSDFRKCYEPALKRDPKLNGRVTVSFVIALDGKATNASPAAPNAASTADVAPPSESTAPPMTDKKVIDCVVSGFSSLQFPRPDGGTVSVVYPIVLTSTQAPK